MPIIDPADPDRHLVWPRVPLSLELDRRIELLSSGVGYLGLPEWSNAVQLLLYSAFNGPAIADEFEAQATDDQLPWLRRLRGELDTANAAAPLRPYWSQRSGAAPEALSTEATMDRFANLVDSLASDGLWAQRFGVNCPDGGDDPIDPPDIQIEDRLGRHIGTGTTWPLKRSRRTWTTDDFYDLMEVLHDLASMPASWSGHSYGGCIGHPGNFSPATGQALYRARVNDLLDRSEISLRLAESGVDPGRLVVVAGGGLDDAVEEAIVVASPEHADEVQHAIALFRSRARDTESMRSAIVTLVGVMERHRALLKNRIAGKDEAALFEIANKFDLRHRKPDQHGDYDPAFLEWIFHWYLATVALLGRLTETEAATAISSVTFPRPLSTPAPAVRLYDGEEPF